MTQKVFTVYDSKLEIYNAPFLAINKGHALRLIEGLVRRPDHDFNRHAMDFTLFEIGEYDDTTGTYTMEPARVPIAGLWELRETESPSAQLPLNLQGQH